jgi:hypothetical protein
MVWQPPSDFNDSSQRRLKLFWWLAPDIPAMHPKRAGVAGRILPRSEIHNFNSSDSITECFGEIDEMVPRGQNVSEMRGKTTKSLDETT